MCSCCDVLVLRCKLLDTRVGPLAGTPLSTTRYRGTGRRRRVRPGGASGGRDPSLLALFEILNFKETQR